jgi:hypothetical protein
VQGPNLLGRDLGAMHESAPNVLSGTLAILGTRLSCHRESNCSGVEATMSRKFQDVMRQIRLWYTAPLCSLSWLMDISLLSMTPEFKSFRMFIFVLNSIVINGKKVASFDTEVKSFRMFIAVLNFALN